MVGALYGHYGVADPQEASPTGQCLAVFEWMIVPADLKVTLMLELFILLLQLDTMIETDLESELLYASFYGSRQSDMNMTLFHS